MNALINIEQGAIVPRQGDILDEVLSFQCLDSLRISNFAAIKRILISQVFHDFYCTLKKKIEMAQCERIVKNTWSW